MLANSLSAVSGLFGQPRVRQVLPYLIVSLLAVAVFVLPTSTVWAGHGGTHLTVSTFGTGGGTVIGSGISCSLPPVNTGDCTQDYTTGTQVTLNASAASGSVFSGWSGNC